MSADADPLSTDSVSPKAPSSPTLVPLDPPRDEAREVWDYYLAGWKHRVRGTRPPVLTPERRRLAKARLGTFGLDDLRRAVDGLWASEWHVENGHTSFELVLRDAKHIEAFGAKAPKTPSAPLSGPKKPVSQPPAPMPDGDHLARAQALAANVAARMGGSRKESGGQSVR